VALSKGPQRVEATFGTSQDLGGYNWTLLAHRPGPRARALACPTSQALQCPIIHPLQPVCPSQVACIHTPSTSTYFPMPP
jgi:hypothetical protein